MSRKIPLPRAWNRRTKAAILQILALSHYAFTVMIARAANEQSRRTITTWPQKSSGIRISRLIVRQSRWLGTAVVYDGGCTSAPVPERRREGGMWINF